MYVLAWMSPIILGLVLAPLISLATSLTAPRWVESVLATPEDLQRPPVVAEAEDAFAAWTALLAKRPHVIGSQAPAGHQGDDRADTRR